jgi:RNA polymerase sigma-70 factor, ECF subfamily
MVRATLQLLIDRDPRGFDALYAEFHERIWAFLMRCTRNRSEAEDLFQETWVSAAKHAHRLRDDSDLRAWLYAIARSKFYSSRRFLLFDTRKKEAFSFESTSGRAIDDALADKRTLEALSQAFTRLSEAHREVLILVFIEELSTGEIAQILELSEAAVRKRLSRARSDLEDAMKQLGQDGGAR